MNSRVCLCKDNNFVCKECFNSIKETCNELIGKDEQKERQLNEAYEELNEAKQELNKAKDELYGLKTQFYTAIGFLLVITTAITSSVYFYSEWLPIFIETNVLLKSNWYGPALYFGSPILLVFFTFLFSIWFFRSVSNYEGHPIWKFISGKINLIINLGIFFLIFVGFIYIFNCISKKYSNSIVCFIFVISLLFFVNLRTIGIMIYREFISLSHSIKQYKSKK